MALYPYRCREHGSFDVQRGITAPTIAVMPCPTCGDAAARVFSPPMLARTSRAVAAAHYLEEKSRDAPEVVTSLPARGAAHRVRRAGPAQQGLPRP